MIVGTCNHVNLNLMYIDLNKSQIFSESSAWKKFTKKDGHIATCNTCHKDYSYKGSVSNLTKHWRKKHARHLSMSSDVSDRNSDDSDEEQ